MIELTGSNTPITVQSHPYLISKSELPKELSPWSETHPRTRYHVINIAILTWLIRLSFSFLNKSYWAHSVLAFRCDFTHPLFIDLMTPLFKRDLNFMITLRDIIVRLVVSRKCNCTIYLAKKIYKYCMYGKKQSTANQNQLFNLGPAKVLINVNTTNSSENNPVVESNRQETRLGFTFFTYK